MIRYTWNLADGWSWDIAAVNTQAEPFVAQLGAAMQLHPVEGYDPNVQGVRRLVLAATDKPKALEHSLPGAIQALRRGALAHCDLELPSPAKDSLPAQLMSFCTLFGADAQTRGGILVHGALAARSISAHAASGILLAAPGGMGKTTASNRLPTPWSSLCDDTTLVVRDTDGKYWAHPMPTWSRFFGGGAGGSWNTSKAVRLGAIFFLEQASAERAAPLGAGHAAAALVQSIEQASRLMTRDVDDDFARTLRSEWFENASALTRQLLSFHLQLTLTGAFLEEIERSLNWDSCDA
jgi:SynChlorMet cassette protein ScmC